MLFNSTRNKRNQVSSKKAILQGISDEGGLFVPESFPNAGSPSNMTEMKYKDLAYYICGKFLTDFTPEELSHCVSSAYNTDNFSTEFIAPIQKLNDRYILELFHGRTSAFKDMALSILPYFIESSLNSQKDYSDILIITATSGDTGKAALEGFKNVDHIKIAVFYPEKGVSDTQKLQMQTQDGDNVFVLGVEGNFDDCQRAVKTIFADEEFNKLLKSKNTKLSSANSINIGRLIPQIVYYYNAYITMLKFGEIAEDEKVNIVVPTGNFGNILAAYYAMEMGLPVNKLICASNDNNVLTDFINTGVYDSNRELVTTPSPSMDILVSSNLERFLYHISGNDDELIAALMGELRDKGKYRLPEDLRDKMPFLKAYYATEEEASNKILYSLINDQYLLDTHTAVASVCYDKYRMETEDNTKTIIASTASPYKFSNAMLSALKIDTENMTEQEKIEKLGDLTSVKIPDNLMNLDKKEKRFTQYAPKEEIFTYLNEFVKGDENA